MKKEVVIILALLFVLSAGVLAQTISDENSNTISKSISENVEEFIKEFVEKTGVANQEEVQSINEINQSNLPKDIEIKNVNENRIGIFEVNYTNNNESKKVFIVTYSTLQLPKKEFSMKNIQYLNFGYSKTSKESSYIETSAGVALSDENGYVMLRTGSITGISTSLDIEGKGKVNIKIYKNGEDTGFSNMISTLDKRKIDYDVQSENIIEYNPGDVISVYVEKTGNVKWGNVVTIVETTG